MSKLERASFGSKLGVILATAGSAVGLGNIWRFPYMTGQNGGAVFIIIYIFCVLLLVSPVWSANSLSVVMDNPIRHGHSVRSLVVLLGH